VANILGNIVIGRFADRFTILILASGLATLAAALAVLALCATLPTVAIAAFLVIGLVGVALNPAMVVRVMRAAHPGPLVNSLHTSVITAGLALGTWAGGAAIDRGYGLTAPLWVGVALAILGLLSLAPPSLRRA
jgi:predicted MFS family arabinose efflux permease